MVMQKRLVWMSIGAIGLLMILLCLVIENWIQQLVYLTLGLFVLAFATWRYSRLPRRRTGSLGGGDDVI